MCGYASDAINAFDEGTPQLYESAEARLGLDLRDGALQEAPPPHLARRGVPAPRRRRAQDARRAAQEQDALREVF